MEASGVEQSIVEGSVEDIRIGHNGVVEGDIVQNREIECSPVDQGII